MPKLSYWVTVCENDSQCYSLRAKTKKEIQALFDSGNYDPAHFGPIKKVSLEYANAFDLMMECMSEGNGWWENQPDS